VPALADLTLGFWAVLELSVRIREAVRGKGRRERDRGTRVLIALTLGGAVGLTGAAASLAPSLGIPAPARTGGLILMWLGLALRVGAIVALGGDFRTTVEVDPGQIVVTTGPYKRIRHPAYAGLLLIVAGFGLSRGNWLSFAGSVVLPLPAIIWRIDIEEAELTRVLGDAYKAYKAGTARLIPWLW
jgi:protein-S-isoprenylcysteine O-methyltransferase Ste14